MAGTARSSLSGLLGFLVVAAGVLSPSLAVANDLVPGDQYFGRVAFADDIDVLAIDGLASSRLDLTVRAEKG